MRIRILFLCFLLIGFPFSSNAQFIGIRIGIPATGTPGMGGGGVPSNALTFNGQVMTFNGQTMTFTHS